MEEIFELDSERLRDRYAGWIPYRGGPRKAGGYRNEALPELNSVRCGLALRILGTPDAVSRKPGIPDLVQQCAIADI